MKQENPVKYLVSGGVGGICTVLAGHPLDTIKVRLQTMPKSYPGESPLYQGAIDCAMVTVKSEGFLALYSGMAAPLAAVTLMSSLVFLGFGFGKKLQQSHRKSHLTYPQIFKAGMVAAVFQTTVSVPVERIKCLLQTQVVANTRTYSGPTDCFKQLYRSGGVRSLYKGTCITLMRDLPAVGVYFVTYEWLQHSLTPPGHSRSDLSASRTLVAGGVAGEANWMVSLWADVLKSRLQTAPEDTYPNGVRDVFRHLIKEEGPKALFKGIGPVLVRAFPANAACFLGFEVTLKCINYLFPDDNMFETFE